MLYMRDGLFMVMYALLFKDELLIEWQAKRIEEAIREKEDILSMSNDLKDDKEMDKPQQRIKSDKKPF